MPINDDIRVRVKFSQFALIEEVVIDLTREKKVHIIPEPVPDTKMTVREHNIESVYRQLMIFWQPVAQKPIAVALHRQCRSDLFQRFDHFWLANIAGMEDLIRLLCLDRRKQSRLKRFGSIPNMGVS